MVNAIAERVKRYILHMRGWILMDWYHARYDLAEELAKMKVRLDDIEFQLECQRESNVNEY